MKVDLNYLLVVPCQCLGHLTWHPWECYCPSHLGHQPCQCCLSCLGKHHWYSPQSPGEQEVEILSHAWKMCWHVQKTCWHLRVWSSLVCRHKMKCKIYLIWILSFCSVRVSPCDFADLCAKDLPLPTPHHISHCAIVA